MFGFVIVSTTNTAFGPVTSADIKLGFVVTSLTKQGLSSLCQQEKVQASG
jgi:hypothetical protein